MNTTWYTEFDGNSWEEMCDKLLSLKHGAKYQPISDKNGDMGIDGLLLSEGTAYQAYGQEPENKDPVKGVKNKIREDLEKLKKNQKELIEILQGKKIVRWVLLLNKKIPCNSIHTYIAEKKKELLNWKLPHVSEEVEVTIQEPSFFETEYLEYGKRKDGRVRIDVELTPAPERDKLLNNENFVAVYNKFRLAVDTDEEARALTYEEIKNHLEKAIILEEIQRRETEFYSAIEDIRSTVEKEAEQGSILEGSYSSFSQTKNSLENQLSRSIGNKLCPAALTSVRDYIIADWFVRCPLRFKKKK